MCWYWRFPNAVSRFDSHDCSLLDNLKLIPTRKPPTVTPKRQVLDTALVARRWTGSFVVPSIVASALTLTNRIECPAVTQPWPPVSQRGRSLERVAGRAKT